MVGENAPTAAQRIAFLKEVIAIHRRQVAAGQVEEITSSREPGCKSLLAALSILGDELVDVGDRQGAMACLRIVVELDLDDRLRCRMA